MDKDQLDRIYALFEKVRSNNATEEEEREYVQVVHEAGFIKEDLYQRYCRGEDFSWAMTLAKLFGAFVRLYYRPEDFQPMENLPKDLVKVTITEKKRVKVKDSWALIDDPKVDIYVSRKDLQLFHEEMTLFRTEKDMGMIPKY